VIPQEAPDEHLRAGARPRLTVDERARDRFAEAAHLAGVRLDRGELRVEVVEIGELWPSTDFAARTRRPAVDA
jgi:hypothetical protein